MIACVMILSDLLQEQELLRGVDVLNVLVPAGRELDGMFREHCVVAALRFFLSTPELPCSVGQRPPTWKGHVVKHTVLPCTYVSAVEFKTMLLSLLPRPLLHRTVNAEKDFHPPPISVLAAVSLYVVYRALVVYVSTSVSD